MSCLHDDCFTCPYADCISETEPKTKKKSNRGRKAIPVDVKHRRKIEYDRKFYQAHREQKLAYAKKRYEERKKENNGKVTGC